MVTTFDYTRIAVQVIIVTDDRLIRGGIGFATDAFDGIGRSLGRVRAAIGRYLDGWRHDLRLVWYAATGNGAAYYAT